MSAIYHLARFTLLEAWRTRYGLILLVLLITCSLFSMFMAGQAITETQTIRTSMLAASLRLISLFVLCVYVINSFVREMNDKGMELTLALPITRSQYLLGKILGFVLLGLITAILCGVSLYLNGVQGEITIWTLSLFAEALLLIALCVACVLSFTQLVSALTAVMAFYLLARSIAAIQLMSSGPLVNMNETTNVIIHKLVDLISLVLPDLSRFTRTEWLLTQPIERLDFSVDWGSILLQTVIYAGLLICLGLIDLSRKNLDH